MILLSKTSNKLIYIHDWEDDWDIIYEEAEDKVIKRNLKVSWLVWAKRHFDFIGFIG